MNSAADLTINEFLSQLAAKQPTPGGGSSSALGGALGTALASMAAAFTVDNEKYAEFDAAARQAALDLQTLRAEFVRLIDLDISAYQTYRAAVALPKNTADEIEHRKQVIASAKTSATLVPAMILAAAQNALLATDRLSRTVNPNLAGDVASAAYFLEACARGAAIQIFSNSNTPDAGGANATRRAEASDTVNACARLRETIDAQVLKLLGLSA